MKKAWAGRFKEKTQKSVEMFTASVSFDKRLWKYDIEGSIAHAQMLKKQKIISARDAALILRGSGKSELQGKGSTLHEAAMTRLLSICDSF
jgi:argininosuccinate lyase